jgi:RNA polymerase sigma-70 factor (ECF subfamily)
VRALDGLPEQFREAALLCDVCGLTPAEAGAVTGVAEGTMKSRSFRARALLAAALRADGAEPVTESGV